MEIQKKNRDDLPLKIKRSSRKTISIEINRDATVLVRAPLRMPDIEIYSFIEEKRGWIMRNLRKMEDRKEIYANIEPLTEGELHKLARKALAVIPKKVATRAREMQVTYGNITIRNQRTRWGSCSSKGNLNFNCLLMLAPEEVLDYVIIHELAHRKEMNHSKAFWNIVEAQMPDYKEKIRWLKENGDALMQRMA